MNVDQASRRSGGSHRAETSGPSPLVVLATIVLLAALGAGAYVLLGTGDAEGPERSEGPGSSADRDSSGRAASSPSSTPTESPTDARTPEQSPGASDGTPAADPGAAAAGRSLAGNDAISLGAQERRELEEGRVDLRVLALLALLTTQDDYRIADFAAPRGDGSAAAYVVDIDQVGGQPVTAAPGRRLVDVARDQRGDFRPAEVTLGDEAIRIAFSPGDAAEP